MKNGFTLVELIIVVAILGILGAVVMPIFQNHITMTKESVAKDTLRTLREAIERYAADNGIAPGYKDNDPAGAVGFTIFWAQLIRDGKYLPDLPENPFNKNGWVNVVANSGSFPGNQDDITGQHGWIYDPATKKVLIDWPGDDSKGVAFFSY